MRLTPHVPLTVAALAVALVTPIAANEPIWTEEEHRDHRDLVVEATVLAMSDEGEISDSTNLWKGVLEIEEVLKADGRVDRHDEIEIYFEQPRDRGQPGRKSGRCPSYPRVEDDERKVFYLSQAEHWDSSTAYWLAIGQDVQPVAEEERIRLPSLRGLLERREPDGHEVSQNATW